MASRSFSKSLRMPMARQVAVSQQRTFVAASSAVRAGLAARPAPVAAPVRQQARGVKTIDFAGVKEDVFGTDEPNPSTGSAGP